MRSKALVVRSICFKPHCAATSSHKAWAGLALCLSLITSHSLWAEPLIGAGADSATESRPDAFKTVSGLDPESANKAVATPPAARTPVQPSNSAAPGAAATEADVSGSTPSSMKEAVRPMLDEMAATGLLDSARNLATDLGLRRSGWSSDDQSHENAQTNKLTSDKRAWDGAPDPGDAQHPVKTAAQREMDNEMSAYLVRKMIDEIMPWLLSALGLYVLWQLGKWGVKRKQQKAERRQKRLRHHLRASRGKSHPV